jgi:hypothetical protein
MRKAENKNSEVGMRKGEKLKVENKNLEGGKTEGGK